MSASIDSRKDKTFTFQRRKLVCKREKFCKRVCLVKNAFPNPSISTLQDALTQNMVVSHSGRTLAEILNLSYSQELSKYNVESVVPGIGREGTMVTYSRPESEVDVGSIFPLLYYFHSSSLYRICDMRWRC
jgi:hypothetical protein